MTCHRAFNVWPKTTLLLPVWRRDTKSLDAPARGSTEALAQTGVSEVVLVSPVPAQDSTAEPSHCRQLATSHLSVLWAQVIRKLFLLCGWNLPPRSSHPLRLRRPHLCQVSHLVSRGRRNSHHDEAAPMPPILPAAGTSPVLGDRAQELEGPQGPS